MGVKPQMLDKEDDAQPGNEIVKARAAPSNNPIVEELNKFNMVENTFRDSAFWPESMRRPYNPDDLVMRRYDYSIYEEMVNDDQVSVCLQLKKDLVLGSGFEIITDDEEADEDEAAEKMPLNSAQKAEKQNYLLPPESGKNVTPPANGAEEDDGEDAPEMEDDGEEELDINSEMRMCLETALNDDPEYDFETSLEEILTAYEFGFSLSEVIFKQKDDGGITLKSIKARHPATWLIHTDPHGNVYRFEQRGPRTSIDIDPAAILHYTNSPRFQNPYGSSDLRPAYNAWFVKREIIKFYAIFLEGGASPKPVARYDKNAPQEAVDAIYNAIKNLQTKSAMVIPKEIEMDYLESNNIGDAYTKGINIFNMFIGRALLIPDLLGFQGGETSGGSYSLGKDQMMVLFKHIQKRRRELEKLINKNIIRPLVINNFGPQEKYPKFRFKEINDEKAIDLAKVWLEAVKGKLFKASDEEINYFRELCKFPVGVVDREEPKAPTDPFGNPIIPPQNPMGGKVADKDEETPRAPAPANTPPPVIPQDTPKKKDFVKAYDPTPGNYEKKVNFKLLKSKLDLSRESIMNEAKPIIREIYDDLFTQIRDKKILQSQDLDKIEKLKIKKLGKLRALLKKKFSEMYKDAQAQAKAEIASGAITYAKAPLANEDFLKFLDSETFQYIGDFEYNITKTVRLQLIQAIKDGKPLSDVLGVLDDEGIALSEVSLERYSRTKLTEVMNRGRNEFFESTGVVAAYQYSAVLDDRTSEICDGLHGKIFDKGDEPVPPMHFNCRSVLIPITKYEPYKADKTVESDGKNVNIDKFIDDNIGDGFSRQ